MFEIIDWDLSGFFEAAVCMGDFDWFIRDSTFSEGDITFEMNDFEYGLMGEFGTGGIPCKLSLGTLGFCGFVFMVLFIEGPFLTAFGLIVGLIDLLSSPYLISLKRSC